MADHVDGPSLTSRPSEILLEGSGLFHLPLCSRDIAISRHERIAVLWVHTADGERRIGIPLPIEALRDLAVATIDALAKPMAPGAAGDHSAQ